MQKRVVHFVRKLLPSTASFIRNQIISHINYAPAVVYKQYVDSVFAKEIQSICDYLFLEGDKVGIELKLSKLLYDKFRKVTNGDVLNILRFVKERDVKILHFHYGSDAVMYLDIIKCAKLPSVVSFYGYDCSSFPRRYLGFGKYFLLNVFRHIDYVLAMSEDMKNDLVRLGCPHEKIIVHYYGTDVLKFAQARDYVNKDDVTLLTISSHDEKKGHIQTIKALENLSDSVKNIIRYRVVGDGPLRILLENYVNEHRLGNRVVFVGQLQYLSKDFLQELHSADIFVHPSVVASNGDKEGIPGTILEAMAAGLPVISTYHAGIPSVIQHGKSGLLVNESDTHALAESISQLAENAELRRKIGKNGQKYVLDQLDLAQKETELEEIYDAVIEGFKR